VCLAASPLLRHGTHQVFVIILSQMFLLQEESAFTGVASQCLSVLVLGINTHLDACLQVGWQPTDWCLWCAISLRAMNDAFSG
jgi:hypothetical protein